MFKCKTCNKEFKDQRTLKIHTAYHNLQYNLECHKCNRKFALNFYYQKHINTCKHGEEKENINYICKICNREFKNYQALNGHMASHNFKYDYECPKCNKKFVFQFQYQKHINACKHGEEKQKINYICKICDKQFPSKASLGSHKRNHTTIIYECPKCDRHFQRRTPFNKHIEQCDGHKTGLFICEKCGKRYIKKQLFINHIENCEGKKEIQQTIYTCEKCDRKFYKEKYYKNHKCKIKITQNQYSCEKCKKIYKYKKFYQKHINNCTGIKKYICKICGKEFKTHYSLGGHAATHQESNFHKKEKFTCQICSKEFFCNKGSFNGHVKNHNEIFKNNKINKSKTTMKEFFEDVGRSKKFREIHSIRMKNNNPMYKQETRNKMIESNKKRIKNLSNYEYNKMVMNFINAPKKGNAVKHSGKYTPTKPEQIVIDFNIPGLIYNGNKKDSTTLRFANRKYKRSLTPDFIYEGTNKVVEVFGVYWHPKEDEEKYTKACKENGYEVLIIWEDKLYENPELEKQKIIEFYRKEMIDE